MAKELLQWLQYKECTAVSGRAGAFENASLLGEKGVGFRWNICYNKGIGSGTLHSYMAYGCIGADRRVMEWKQRKKGFL